MNDILLSFPSSNPYTTEPHSINNLPDKLKYDAKNFSIASSFLMWFLQQNRGIPIQELDTRPRDLDCLLDFLSQANAYY